MLDMINEHLSQHKLMHGQRSATNDQPEAKTEFPVIMSFSYAGLEVKSARKSGRQRSVYLWDL